MKTHPLVAFLVLGVALSVTGCRREDRSKGDAPDAQEGATLPLTARAHADLTVALGRAVILEEHLHRSGELAAKRGASEDVRSLGQRLVERHAGSAALLRTHAEAAGLSLPPAGARPSPPGPDTGTLEPGRFDSGPMPGTMTGGRGSGVGMSGSAPPDQSSVEVPPQTPEPRRASLPTLELTTEWQEREADRIFLATLSGDEFDRRFLDSTARAIERVLDGPLSPAAGANLDASHRRFAEDLREVRELLESRERHDVRGVERGR